MERRFGLQSSNLMALDSNCRRDRSGLMLPHYSPWPTPASEGVNAFAQPIPLEHNIYAFPPFVLLGPLLSYFFGSGIPRGPYSSGPRFASQVFLVGFSSVCRGRSPFSWQEGRRCCVAFSLSFHACLVGATSSVGLVGLSLYFLIFSRLWSSARFRDLGNQPVFKVRACIRITQMLISVKRVQFPLRPWCQLFPMAGVL